MTDSAPVTDAVAPGVGDELARARAALGLSIADIERQLKFAARQIEAMEQGRFEALPSGTFARGMVRSYARFLKLDAEQLVARMAARVVAPDNTEAVVNRPRPIPITDNQRRGNLIYAALSVTVLGVSAAVVFEWQREHFNATPPSLAPAAQQSQAPLAPRSVADLGDASDVTPHNLALLAASDAAAVPSMLASSAQGAQRIVLKFARLSWVEVRDRDGKILLSQLNAAGSEQALEGQAPFSLIIGNAQGVRLSYEDRQIDLAPHSKADVARLRLE